MYVADKRHGDRIEHFKAASVNSIPPALILATSRAFPIRVANYRDSDFSNLIGAPTSDDIAQHSLFQIGRSNCSPIPPGSAIRNS